MRRTLSVFGLFMLVGAIVNIAVAWYEVLPVDLTGREAGHVWAVRSWPLPVPEGWPAVQHEVSRSAPGYDSRYYVAYADREARWTWHYRLELHDSGWPLRSLRRERRLEGTINTGAGAGGVVTGEARNDAALPAPLWRTGITFDWPLLGFGPTGWKALPLEPLAIGFAVDTLFYAAILAGLFLAPPRLRRALRLRRGLCPACGYSLAGLGAGTHCPECGSTAR